MTRRTASGTVSVATAATIRATERERDLAAIAQQERQKPPERLQAPAGRPGRDGVLPVERAIGLQLNQARAARRGQAAALACSGPLLYRRRPKPLISPFRAPEHAPREFTP